MNFNINDIKDYMSFILQWLVDQPSPVGCALLSPTGNILLFHNEGRKHCEQIICEKFFCLEHYIIFLTLEPCLSCAFLLARKKISKIFFGAYNLEHGALGGCINIFQLGKNYNTEYWGGILKEECESFIKNFFKKKREEINEIQSI